MKTADVGINTVTYGCMLDACVKCGAYEKAEDVFAEMKGAGPPSRPGHSGHAAGQSKETPWHCCECTQ